MGKIDKKQVSKIKRIFKLRTTLTVNQLTELLRCSIISARRYLKKWNAYTSYNKKGCYYTLPTTPKFNDYGLWHYKNVYFTKHGNLKKTIIYLLKKSQIGMSAKEIGEIVGLNPGSFMHHFRDIPGLRREKQQGRFIYFSDDPEIYSKQKQKFVSLVQEKAKRMPSDADAVLILVQLIKHPNISIEELAKRMARQGKSFEPSVIKNFLEHHDLFPTKKKRRI